MKPWQDTALAANGLSVRENFSDWFGQSKVVTPEGEPMVLYHGTTQQFTSFGKSKDIGFHFGTLNQAEDRLGCHTQGLSNPGEKIIPVFLSIRNPLRMQDRGDWGHAATIEGLEFTGIFPQEEIDQLAYDLAYSEHPDQEYASFEMIRAFIESKGYDGIVYLNRAEGFDGSDREDAIANAHSDGDFMRAVPEAQDSYIAFRPHQIKAADNVGLFLKGSPCLYDYEAEAALKASAFIHSRPAERVAP